LKDANGGEYTDSLAAVTAGDGACNARFALSTVCSLTEGGSVSASKQAAEAYWNRNAIQTSARYYGALQLTRANGNNAVDKEGVRIAGSKLKDVISNYDDKQLRLSAWGTTGLSEYMDKFHLFPINNYQYGQRPESSRLFAKVFLDKYFSKQLPDGCYYGCNLACAKGAENVELTRGLKQGSG